MQFCLWVTVIEKLSKNHFRAILLVALLGLVISPIGGYVTYVTNPQSEVERQAELPPDRRNRIVGEADGITVITAHGQGGAPRFAGELIAFDSDGRLLYYNDSLDSYFDVDPIPNTSATVVYVGGNRMDITCDVIGGRTPCKRNVIETVNLTTGEVTRLFSTPGKDTVWHDVDRLNETHYLIADIDGDRVFIIDISSGAITWQWSVRRHFDPVDSGGDYPNDWTHLNDVEHLDNGWIMLSLRNQDQVVFVDPGRGMLANWTLGADDDRDILYEQHNPDYIPAGDGGPAVLVADTENSRIVEYQQTGNSWQRSWVWIDSTLQWPRDADRLPNGHTLITDTHGSRVIEINETGHVVWTAEVFGGYEAERLGTGDESEGGKSARLLDLPNRTESDRTFRRKEDTSVLFVVKSMAADFVRAIRDTIPSIILNGLLFIRPRWMSSLDLVLVALSCITVLVWGGLEVRWSTFTVRSPIVRRNDR